MPSAIDASQSRLALRVSSIPSKPPFGIGRGAPVLHSRRVWWHWLRTLGGQRESAMDQLAREEPYRYILASLW
jgi:hypothetical protein